MYARGSCISQVIEIEVGAGRQEQVSLPLASSASTSEHRAQQAFLCSTNRCQLSKWNCSAVSLLGCILAKIQLDYKPIAPACPRSRKSLSAGWWDLLTATDSAAAHLLQCGCRSSLGAVALCAGLMNAALPPSPGWGNDDFLGKKKKNRLKKDKMVGEARCTATSSFLWWVISWQNILWSSSHHILSKHYHSDWKANTFLQNKKIAFISHTVWLWTAWL